MNKNVLNANKIRFWNQLRVLCNKIVLFMGAIFVVMTSIFHTETTVAQRSLSYLDMENPLVPVFIWVVYYIALVNFLLILLELIDRMGSFRERPIFKKSFKAILLASIVIVPLISMYQIIML